MRLYEVRIHFYIHFTIAGEHARCPTISGNVIVVKMPCKLLYVIQVKGFIKCSTSWPYLISEVLVAYNHCGF